MKIPCTLPVIPASRIECHPSNIALPLQPGGCRAPSCNADGIMSVACYLDSSASHVTEIESVAEATAGATEIVETTVAVQIEVDHPAAMAAPLPSVRDFSCPICLELLLPGKTSHSREFESRQERARRTRGECGRKVQ